jgi:hypothetical protein
MSVPLIGQSYRGVDGHSGFLLRQAWQALARAMDEALAAHGLSPAQYGALSVLAREPGVSGADLARRCNTTPGNERRPRDPRARGTGRAPPSRDPWPHPPGRTDEQGQPFANEGKITILKGRSGAQFGAPRFITVGDRPAAVLGARLNRDGLPDIAAAVSTGGATKGHVSVLLKQ